MIRLIFRNRKPIVTNHLFEQAETGQQFQSDRKLKQGFKKRRQIVKNIFLLFNQEF